MNKKPANALHPFNSFLTTEFQLLEKEMFSTSASLLNEVAGPISIGHSSCKACKINILATSLKKDHLKYFILYLVICVDTRRFTAYSLLQGLSIAIYFKLIILDHQTLMQITGCS